MVQYQVPQPHYHTTTTTISLPHPLSNLQYHNATTTLPQYNTHKRYHTYNAITTIPLSTDIIYEQPQVANGRNLCLPALNSQTAKVVHCCEFPARPDYHIPRNCAVNEIRRPGPKMYHLFFFFLPKAKVIRTL